MVLLSSVEEKTAYINFYIQTYLEKDIRPIETVTDLNIYRNLMNLLAEQTGSIRNDENIISVLGCTRDTLKKYRGYFTATLFFQELFPYINSTMKRLVKSPKGYLVNNGLISVITGLDQLATLEKSGMIGHRFENWFLGELNTWLARNPRRSEIYYWRLSTGKEVDFVVQKKPHVYPFEVTYGTQKNTKKVRNLAQFIAEVPQADWGYYVYRGPFQLDHKLKICFLPAWVIA